MNENNKYEAYYEEWNDTMDTLYKQNKKYKSIGYFINLRKEFSKYYESNKPKVIVLGTNIPKEIMYAMTSDVVYVLGGSLYASNLSEPIVPRDTDSCIKSILGVIKEGILKIDKDTTVIIPVTCDSMRKMAAILKNEMKVITVEIPSTADNKNYNKYWEYEIDMLIYKIRKQAGIKLSFSALKKQIKQANACNKAFRELDNYLLKGNSGINGAMKMFIAQSYYWTSDKKTWTKHIYQLINEMKKNNVSGYADYRPKVLVVGSPIYAPNYKIPFLLEELGMDLKQCINPVVMDLLNDNYKKLPLTKSAVIKKIASESLNKDLSPAYVKNEILNSQVKKYIDNYHFDGVVFHILKGQIEYDFELRRLEEYFEEKNIPVFRLETDYNYQDVEQLRIRLEAFSEMLQHRYKVIKQGA